MSNDALKVQLEAALRQLKIYGGCAVCKHAGKPTMPHNCEYGGCNGGGNGKITEDRWEWRTPELPGNAPPSVDPVVHGECCPSGWISVKDRLPEAVIEDDDCKWSDFVLVYTQKGIGISQFCMDDEDSESGWCDARALDGARSFSAASITHWMPLPKPPEEEKI